MSGPPPIFRWPTDRRRSVLRTALAVFFVGAGINHFVSPGVYWGIVPPGLPFPGALVFVSGAAEIAGGIGVLIPRWRRAAAWGLIALLLAVFPANIHAALYGMVVGETIVPAWLLWFRLPLQAAFVAWVHWTCLRPELRDVRAG